MGDQLNAMLNEHVCAHNAELSSSTPYNVEQERPLLLLEDQGKAMLTEGMREQKNSFSSLNVLQGEPLFFLRSSNEDRQMQSLPVVADESLMTMDLIVSQPNPMEPTPTMEPLDIAPTIGGFTVQCGRCMKWRFIPTKEQYEVIRQSILENPFFCSSASIWRPNASCRDPLEISPDLHELWAVDRPSIPLPPDGWERLLVIRPQGSSKFADVYYITPSGRKLRSMPEIVRYLEEHPEYAYAGLKLSQFSFLIPKPLDKDYCRRKNESLTGVEKGTLSQKKSYSKNFLAESYLKKIGIVQSSFKGISPKPKLEKLKCRKKALTGVILDGESREFQGQEQSLDSLDCKQVLKTPSEELEKKPVWDCVNATSALGKVVGPFVTSLEQHPMSSRTEVQGASCHVK